MATFSTSAEVVRLAENPLKRGQGKRLPPSFVLASNSESSRHPTRGRGAHAVRVIRGVRGRVVRSVIKNSVDGMPAKI